MKKILLASAAIIFTITLASAQTDTTKVVPFTTRKADSTSYRTPKAVEDPSKDMIKIPNNQVPFSLRSTLQGSEYKGWENNGVVYQNPGTSEYAVQINTVDATSTTKAPVWYRFDVNGKRITNPQN